MANIYTTPSPSQFIPTYAPINLDAINIGAQAMQNRQMENFSKLDQIQETSNLLKKNLLEQDKPIFDEDIKDIRSQLDQLSADGDLSDANRQIRSIANRFKERISTDRIGNAFQNYQRVMEKYKQIDDSNLSDIEKQSRKNAVIAGYKGVDKGGLDLSINTDDIDVNKFIKDTLGDIDKQTIVSGSQWKVNPSTGKFEKGEITQEGIPYELIQSTIMNSLSNNMESLSALKQRARISTAGQDEFVVIDENGNEKIVSREEKEQDIINNQIESIIELANQKYGSRITKEDYSDSSSNNSGGSGGYDDDINTGVKRGNTLAMNIGINSFNDAASKIRNKKALGKIEEADSVESSLNRSLLGWIESDNTFEKDGVENKGTLTREDAKFLMETDKEWREYLDSQKKQIPITVSMPVGTPIQKVSAHEKSMDEVLGKNKADRYKNLMNRFDNWVEKGGGWTDKEVFPTDPKVLDRITDIVKDASNYTTWKIYGKDDLGTKELFKDDSDAKKNIWDTLRITGAVSSNDFAPAMLVGRIEKDGETIPVRLVEKVDPTSSMNDDDVTDTVLRNMGAVGEEIIELRKYEDVNPGFNYRNIRNELPLGMNAINDYIGLRKTSMGYEVQYGTQDDPKAFTVGDYLNNLYEYPKESIKEGLREMINNINKGRLTNEEIGSILDGERNENIKRKLITLFTEPYEFKDKVAAINAGAIYTGIE